jgi:UDP-N-acetylmuramoyl-tripeptide--D-alanyl-D-alanine ligase
MSGYLWTGLALVAPLSARVDGRLPAGVNGVSIDTRTLQPGDLFFAIKGDNSDGHDYVVMAFEKGAAAAVVAEERAADLKGLGPLYVVHDTLRSMENLGRAARARSSARIIAVTGSVGKTGTKEALRLALSSAGKTHASAASYNNHWGVPLTLARMPADARFAVFEIGMNHAGEITPLVGMVRPHVAIITTIAPVHLEHFESIDGIAEAKAEIFSGLDSDGVAIINRDIAQYDLLRERACDRHVGAVLCFGEHEDADARLLGYEQTATGAKARASFMGREVDFELAAPGRHLAMNALAVLLAAEAAGADLHDMARALGEFDAPVGRGQRTQLRAADGPFTLIDESYNANPTSMRAAFALLGATAPSHAGRRIAVLGDMLELGPDAARMHRDLAPDIQANNIDLVFAAGPMMRGLFDALASNVRGGHADQSKDIESTLISTIRAGDVVMVKGSNGSRMGPIVAALKTKFAAPSIGAGDEG